MKRAARAEAARTAIRVGPNMYIPAGVPFRTWKVVDGLRDSEKHRKRAERKWIR